MLARIFSRSFYTNPSSAPKKLILIFAEERDKLSRALAQRIESELHQAHLNAFGTDKLIVSSHVPYTVIISKRTLSDGILELQHYNPQIREEVHVSQLTERLLLQTGTALRCTKSS